MAYSNRPFAPLIEIRNLITLLASNLMRWEAIELPRRYCSLLDRCRSRKTRGRVKWHLFKA